MQREIKFRGKRVDNGEWVYGCLITGFFLRGGKDIPYIMTTDGADYDCFEDIQEGNGIFEVIAETVGQYTGLKDKNGKEIYEGDIVKCVSELYSNFGKYPTGKFDTSFYEIVVPEENSYSFGTRKIGRKHTSRDILRENARKYYEVIGNIHTNPELLEV